MEGITLTPEDDDSDEESTTSKKKKAEALGSFLVEPKKEAKVPKIESIWQKLTGAESEKPEVTPEAEAEIVTSETTAETSVEAEDVPLTELSPLEQQVVERTFVQARIETADESTPEASAVHEFHEKILEQNMTSDDALIETLEDAQADSEPVVFESEAEPVVEAEPAVVAETPIREFDDQPIELTHSQSQPIATQPIYAPRQNTAETTVTTQEARPATNQETDTHLVDGIVGYLAGRRRGRIRTEQRLLPVQEKLKNQVELIQKNLIAKEEFIRRAVIEKQRVQFNIEQSNEQHANQQANSAEQLRRAQQAIIEAPVPPTTEQIVERVRALPLAEQVSTLPRRDVLELASKIVIEGVSVRQMFENNAITEKGMRRIIVEQLRGGDVKRALKREVVEHQIDFERDPIVRDKARFETQSSTTATGARQPLSPLPASDEQPVASQQATATTPTPYQPVTPKRKTSRFGVMDGVMAIVIAILLLIVIWLFMSRH